MDIGKRLFGTEASRGLDVLRRADFSSDAEFLDAVAQYDAARRNPAVREARRQAESEWTERQLAEERARQEKLYADALKSASIGALDRRSIDAEAAQRAKNDLAAGKIQPSELGDRILEHSKALEAAKKREIASNAVMNRELRAMMRGGNG